MKDVPNIQWFPGHMQTARRLIEENLRAVDAVMELRDARTPLAGANPLLGKIIGKKPRLIILTKADLADERETIKWTARLNDGAAAAVAVDILSGTGLKKLTAAMKELAAKKAARLNKARSSASGKIAAHPLIRAMIVGIPNVGKSSLINKLAGENKTKVENRPGVTRAKQWIKAGKGLELLDMPGVLWPKFDDPEVGVKLALTGAVRDETYDTEALARVLLKRLAADESYGKMLVNRFNLENLPTDADEILRLIGQKRGCLIKGGEVDEEKTAVLVLKEFRRGLLGRITLDAADRGEQ